MSNDNAVIDFGIITAITEEFAAVKCMLDNGEDYSKRTEFVKNDPNDYFIGTVNALDGSGKHNVIVTLLPDPGNNISAEAVTNLLRSFPDIKEVLMVGIAGGVPKPKNISKHVRLGDIVVSNKYGIIQYDNIMEEFSKIVIRDKSSRPSAAMINKVNKLESERIAGKYPWEKYIERAAHLENAERPNDDKDILYLWQQQGDKLVIDSQVEHPIDNNRAKRMGQPKIHYGKIGAANTLLKNPFMRDELGDQHDVKAIEMEASGIADGTWKFAKSYIIIRGICDYCDEGKNDIWHQYAAIVAAAYARCLIESCSCSGTSSEKPNGSVTNIAGKDELKKQLLTCGTKMMDDTIFINVFREIDSAKDISIALNKAFDYYCRNMLLKIGNLEGTSLYEQLAKVTLILNDIDIDICTRAYNIVADKYPHKDFTNLLCAIFRLLKLPPNIENELPFIIFIEKVIYIMKNENITNGSYNKLKEWFESFCKKFDEKTCAADSVTLSRNRVVHLLIQIRPQFPNNIKNTYSIQINKWTNTGKNNVIPNENNAKYHDVTFDQIPKIIDDLLCSSFVSNINLERLEFFLPSNLVFWDVDQYNLKELTFRKKLGQNYEIVIRINRLFVDDALKNPAKSSVSRDWRKRWDILQNRMGTFDEKCIKHICDINGYCAENVFDEIDDEDIGDYITCLEIAFRPKTKEDEKDLVNLIWESGIPVAVLHRKSYNSLNSTLELPENTKIINKETISDLPNTVRKIRRKAKGEQHIGNHLTLIWDDPYKTVTFNDAESLHYINKT